MPVLGTGLSALLGLAFSFIFLVPTVLNLANFGISQPLGLRMLSLAGVG